MLRLACLVLPVVAGLVAAWQLPGSDDESLLNFFRDRSPHPDPRRIEELIRELGDPSSEVRERSTEALAGLSGHAVPALRVALAHADPEVARRAEEALRRIDREADSSLPAEAARQLARRRTPGAVAVLLDYLPGVVHEPTTTAVHDALATLAAAAGRPAPALLKALTDGNTTRRTAAGVALARSLPAEDLGRVRRLLADPDSDVRYHVALTLVRRQQADALPVLIELLDQLAPQQRWPVEELLFCLAGDSAPDVPYTAEIAGRRFREAWRKWWAGRDGTIDWSRLTPTAVDRTVVVLLDKGIVRELDTDDKVAWEIANVAFPLDVQPLPGPRVLLAEFNGGRVTERHASGAVLWECRADGPIVAQRLPGGRTFIATKQELYEVDRAGRRVATHGRPGEQYMRATRLPDGGVVYVTNSSRLVRANVSGKEVSGFPVRVSTSGGRIDVQPNGRMLVPSLHRDLVTEFEADGRVVREFGVESPIAATRLANGNTLVTSMQGKRAVEFDLAGKLVWEYAQDTRVTRAVRR